MYILRVAPLANLPNTVPQVLDYFWSDPLPQGALVQVSIGRRSAHAIVLESSDLERAKLTIKKSSFGLKKISKVIASTPQATSGQLALARWMSHQYYAPLGTCLKTILPPWLGKRGRLLSIPDTAGAPTASTPTPHIILTQPKTAVEEIRKRCSTATGQVLVLVPEVALARHFSKILEDFAPAIVHGELKAKEYTAAYNAVLSGAARVVVGTRLALFLPWQTLSDIIVEDPLHEAYKSDMTPRYVAADTARELARMQGAFLTYLSPALSTVNHYLAHKKILTLADRKPYWPDIVMADMVREQRDANHSILSRQAQEALLDAYDDKKRILFFSPRRAYATMLRCRQCQASVSCTTCAIPLRVHRYGNEEMLICYHCASYLQTPKQCPSCHAGALKPAGLAGSQKIAQAINDCLDRHGLPKATIPILDSDLVRSPGDAAEVWAKLDRAEHPILVATQMVFSHRYTQKFDHIVIVQADALSYNPDFRTQERLIYQIEKLADLEPKTMTIQYWDDHGALSHAPGRSWTDFYQQELDVLKTLGWPPFTRIAKLTVAHRDRGTGSRQATMAADRLHRAAVHLGMAKSVQVLGPTPALVERAGGKWSQHIILKTTVGAKQLSELLSHIPPGTLIDIDPRSIS